MCCSLGACIEHVYCQQLLHRGSILVTQDQTPSTRILPSFILLDSSVRYNLDCSMLTASTSPILCQSLNASSDQSITTPTAHETAHCCSLSINM